MLPDALDQYRQPKHTGENRCLPCTAVNLAVAVVLAGLSSFVGTPVLGLLVLGGSLLAIYLRGYLVPGTPELTKQYLPDWVLAMFDKEPAGPRREPEPDLSALDDETDDESESSASVATADDESTADDENAVGDEGTANDEDAADTETAETETEEDTDESEPADPEELLSEMGVVQETEDGEDIELTDAFAEDLLDAADPLRDDEAERAAAIAGLLGADADEASINQEIHGPAFYAGENRIHRWPSAAALLADASAQRALAGREAWETTAPEQRLGIARALRSFIPTCPVCGGAVGLTEERVSSCCRDWEVFAIRCGDCDAHFLELEPGERDEASETIAKESEGARGVSGGFER